MRTLLTSLVGVLLFALVSFTPLSAADWAATIQRVEKSLVYVESSSGACTGFVIDAVRHYVLTAAHCESDSKDMLWVDRVTSRTVSKDSKKDLLVLEVKDIDPTLVALKLAAKNPERGADIMSCGYGFALERPFFRQAHVQDDATVIPGISGNPYISIDAPFVGGQSGGPVVNMAGEVVLIVQRGDGGTTGIGTGAETIRERVGRFFGK